MALGRGLLLGTCLLGWSTCGGALAQELDAPKEAQKVEEKGEIAERYRFLEEGIELHVSKLDERIGALNTALRKKSGMLHRLKESASSPRLAWEEESQVPAQRRQLKKVLELSIKEAVEGIARLEEQKRDVNTDLQWLKMQKIEALTQPALPVTPAPEASHASPSNCRDLPVRLAAGDRVKLSQDFGTRRDKETGIEWQSLGWWITNTAAVQSCASGTVVFTGLVPGRGRVVMIDHGAGQLTLYGNLKAESAATFFKGMKVKAGADIGYPRDRLYFEVRRNGLAVNPRTVLPPEKLALLQL